jgi:hypothetical protein
MLRNAGRIGERDVVFGAADQSEDEILASASVMFANERTG